MRQKKFVVLDAAGLVDSFGSCPALPPGPDVFEVVTGAPAPGQIGAREFIDARDLGKMMRAGDYLVARPVSPLPTVAGNQVTVPPCPAGTRIEIFDITGNEIMATIIPETDDQPEVLQFDDAGEYVIEVQAPAPHLMSLAKVTIE